MIIAYLDDFTVNYIYQEFDSLLQQRHAFSFGPIRGSWFVLLLTFRFAEIFISMGCIWPNVQ